MDVIIAVVVNSCRKEYASHRYNFLKTINVEVNEGVNMDTDLDLRELKEIVQSSSINFLIGAGVSNPYIPALGNIENAIEEAHGDEVKILEQLKKYFENVMLPSVAIIDNGNGLDVADKERFDETYDGYKVFLETVNYILLHRKSSLLNKQVNIFTTNIDAFFEKVAEDLSVEYNDGFSGNLSPQFQTSNFRKSTYKTSAHFSNTAEIPTFNIIKLHGSLTWRLNSSKEAFEYSKMEAVNMLQDVVDDDEKFRNLYTSELQIINPTKNKFQETVMGVVHYELLRMYSDELEKENTVLFVVGFSMADEHIREITKRAANSNPTLKIYIFCYSDGKTKENLEHWFKDMKYQNVEIVFPKGEKRYDIKTINDDFLKTMLSGVPRENLQDTEDLSDDEQIETN